MTDLQQDIGPGNACSGLVPLVEDPRKRWGWLRGFEIAWNNEIVFALFLVFFKFCSGSYASLSSLFWSAHVLYVLRNKLGLKTWPQSSSINALDLVLIHLKIFPKMASFNLFVHLMLLHEFEYLPTRFETWNKYKILSFQCFRFCHDLFWLELIQIK